MQKTKFRFWKNAWWAIVVFGLTMMVVASIKNPSKAQSEARLASMNADMDYALGAGGDVESIYSNAKFGGALLIKNIKAASWTPRLVGEYQTMLLNRSWVIDVSETKKEIFLCKDGMLARIDSSPSTDASHGVPQLVYGFSMSYNANTLKRCKS
jgi:hypothetical protein